MPSKQFNLPPVGTVHIYKRKGTKNIRLSVNSDGKVRVTMPTWLPYRAGLAFAEQKQQWLVGQQVRTEDLHSGQRIGKYHTLRFSVDPSAQRVQTRVTDTEIVVTYPGSKESEIQKAAHTAVQRALRAEADQLLPQRLATLARTYNFEYAGVKSRHLKTRWGSCSSHHQITLNYYLMQLPWELIDYVLLHELAHTKQLNHSAQFWSIVEACLPDYKQRRKELKQYQPSVLTPKSIRSVA